MTGGGGLEHVLVVYETEATALDRLAAFGYEPEIAAEIAVYLAQATDLPSQRAEIAAALASVGIDTTFVEIDALPGAIRTFRAHAARMLIWSLTDGVRFYRGSAVPALARLTGFARYGSAARLQHLGQDKFASLAMAHAAGVVVPPTILLQDRIVVGRIGTGPPEPAGPLFVKPNTLGAKIGIVADSLCADWNEAVGRAARLWDRYGDRALVQGYIEGDDVRVSFLDIGGEFRAQLGIAMLTKGAVGEAAGAFVTMRDNDMLSAAAVAPRTRDLRAATDARARRIVGRIEDAAARLVALLGIADYFSMDFRLDTEGRAHFLEFEVCPAVTNDHFQRYLAATHGLGLGRALGRSMPLAFARAGTRQEA